MSGSVRTVSVNRVMNIRILGKEYQVSCPDGQEHELSEAAYYLNSRMSEINKAGRVVGMERMAITLALNLTNELLQLKQQSSVKEKSLKLVYNYLEKWQNKITAALIKQGDKPQEKNAASKG